MLFCLLHYIYLTTKVTLQIQTNNTKYNEQLNYNVLSQVKIKLCWSSGVNLQATQQ